MSLNRILSLQRQRQLQLQLRGRHHAGRATTLAFGRPQAEEEEERCQGAGGSPRLSSHHVCVSMMYDR